MITKLLGKVSIYMDLWPDFDPTKAIETPKKILEKQGEYLLGKTNGIVYATCEELAKNMISEQAKDYAFRYSFYIASKNLKEYKFDIFSIYHNMTLYPLLIVVEAEVANDIGIKKKIVNGKQEFEELLRAIFASRVIESIIGTLMNI